MTISECKPGQRVRVRHTIERRDQDWHGVTEGVVRAVELQKTGSWYAHSKDGQYWLQRLRLVKDDGEVSELIIDPYTEIELVAEAGGA